MATKSKPRACLILIQDETSSKQLDRLVMAIAELHSAIFIAIKRPVVTDRNWPLAVCHGNQLTI